MPTASPTSPLVPDFDILINGSPLSVEQETHVVSITVEKDAHLLSMFVLEISGSTTRANDLDWIDDEKLFAIGNEVEIKLGYASNISTVFVGEMTSLEPEFASDRPPSLIVRGYDRRHRLSRDRKTRTFTQKKDSDIAAQIASDNQLTPQVKESQVSHEYVVQANQTDLEFLQERARLIEYEVFIENKTLFFQPVANATSEILTLSFDQDLLDFYPRLTSMFQSNQVSVQGWDVKEKQAMMGQAKAGDEVSNMGGQKSSANLVKTAFGSATNHIIDRPVMTQAEADQIAKAQFNHSALGLIYAEGTCWGRTDLQVSKVINLANIGKRFSGKYYVTAVTHRYKSDRGYYTHFQVRRNAV
jgi:phage protein D